MSQSTVELIVDSSLQQEAERIFALEGVTSSDVYRRLLTRVIAEQHVPLDLCAPNQETIAAMRELDKGGGKSYNSVEALMADLLADD